MQRSSSSYRTRTARKAEQLQKQQARGKFLDRRERRSVAQLKLRQIQSNQLAEVKSMPSKAEPLAA
jgi:hypothetical protein